MQYQTLNNKFQYWKGKAKQRWIQTKAFFTKQSLRKNRKTWLLIAGCLGIFLVWFCFFYIGMKLCIEKSNIASNRIINTLFILILSLPISAYLWYLRNHDKLKQIEQAEQNNLFNNFTHAMSLFLEKNDTEKTKNTSEETTQTSNQERDKSKIKNAVGLRLLMKLRNEKKQFIEEIDLATSKANLKNIDLGGTNLQGINLERTNLQNADLQEINLQDANLEKANLRGANLKDSNLQKANLQGTILDHARIRVIKEQLNQDFTRKELENFLKNSDINKDNSDSLDAFIIPKIDNIYCFMPTSKEIDLIDYNLRGANLQGFNLRSTNLQSASLQNANLQDASLQNANLQDAILFYANLQGANLQGANLINTRLQCANLQDTYLQDINLEGAELQGANLQDAILDNATIIIEEKQFHQIFTREKLEDFLKNLDIKIYTPNQVYVRIIKRDDGKYSFEKC